MPAPSPVARCVDASRVFGAGPAAVVAVHGTTCSITDRARVAVIGDSGSGKSTLLHLLAGLERPTTGTVDWPALDETERTFGIGVIFQSPSLVGPLTVAENTALAAQLAGASDPDDRAGDALDLLGLSDLADRLPEEISGGQAQRVAAARVLAQRPHLILADEPTGQLDHDTGQHLMDVLVQVADRTGAALLVSTHDPAVAQRLVEHWHIRAGRLTLSNPEADR
ncbi:ABC transporter ATP-binding protein [Microlunatus ginsengisoli]|uniref:ATP-binding cassette domain-containing protein n=1 Tax=Microlunatus ginsengisoli TaxID=363863 RepID=A0ABP7AJP2_9ACTN